MALRDVTVLLIEDNDGDAKAINRKLHRSEVARFEVERVEWLSSGMTAVQNRRFDVVLLDLSLPDPGAQGIDTLVRFMTATGMVPVIVMTGFNDMETAINCVKYGAQDYLIKDEIRSPSLERSILYAIERRHAEVVSKNLMRASLGTLVPTAGNNPGVALVHEHLTKIPELLQTIRDYVHKNAPACADDIDTILHNYDIEVMLREVRDLVPGTPSGLHRALTYTQHAKKWVKEKTSDHPPPPEAEAKSRLLGAVQRLKGEDDG